MSSKTNDSNKSKKELDKINAIQDSIQNILENDIVANQSYVDENQKRIDEEESEDNEESDPEESYELTMELDENFHYSWEEDFFKKFDCLQSPTEKDEEQLLMQKYKLFLDACKMLQGQFDISKENDPGEDIHYNKLYMYFVSLENENLFLHTDLKKSYDIVMQECLENYDYVKLNNPRKVIFVMEINDLYDVDKYVKMFMHMFGIEKTRGGSYTDIVLHPAFLETIEHEKTIANIDYYIRKMT